MTKCDENEKILMRLRMREDQHKYIVSAFYLNYFWSFGVSPELFVDNPEPFVDFGACAPDYMSAARPLPPPAVGVTHFAVQPHVQKTSLVAYKELIFSGADVDCAFDRVNHREQGLSTKKERANNPKIDYESLQLNQTRLHNIE